MPVPQNQGQCFCDLVTIAFACCTLQTSVGILKPLPKPSKVSEASYDLSVIFLVLWQFGFCCDLV